MRLFVSADVDPLSEAIADVQAPLRGLDGLRPTDPEQAHVTMKFLAEGDHDLDALGDAIETAVAEADVGPFDVSLEGVGVFPSLGYDAEPHAFTPHVTLARMDNAASKADVQEFVETAAPEAGRLRLDELRLTESTLTSEGPVYDTVERFPL